MVSRYPGRTGLVFNTLQGRDGLATYTSEIFFLIEIGLRRPSPIRARARVRILFPLSPKSNSTQRH
jgi:hypothetical protein